MTPPNDHPSKDDGLERLLRDLTASDERDMAYWKGELVRLRETLKTAHPLDQVALMSQVVIVFGIIEQCELNAGMKGV